MPAGTADFTDAVEAERSPLAQALFAVPGVKAVFLGLDFITVTKDDTKEWFVLKPSVLGTIMEHFVAKRPVILDAELSAGHATGQDFGEDAEIVEQIKELLDTKVRPAVAQDGGDIVFHGFERGIVYLQMRGSCAGCPSSTATLKAGIENMLRHYIPEVIEVRAAA